MHANTAAERFYALAWPHRALVLRSARLLESPADADDLAQETMLKAFSAIDRFRPGEGGIGMKAWLLRILRNTHLDRHRARQARVQAGSLGEAGDVAVNAEVEETFGTDPDALMEAFSDAQIIHALQTLPEDMRWTLLLTDIEGLDHAEAAEIVGVPTGTVKSRVFRARAMLREALLPVARDLGVLPRSGGIR